MDYLCIGHCCHDKVGEDFILGGTASYASIVAKFLGKDVSIITSTGSDFKFQPKFESLGISVYNKRARQTTIFENIYSHGKRTQYLLSRADTISIEDVPSNLIGSKVIHMCMIAQEFDFSTIPRLESGLIGASIQGAIRKWDDTGLISPSDMNWEDLANVDVVVLSMEDIAGREDYLSQIIRFAGQTVLTKGEHGAVVYKDGHEYFFPSFPIEEVEATGAGDVFTAAYLIKYQETKNISTACIYAHCAASIVIEARGVENLKELGVLDDRVALYHQRFHSQLASNLNV